MKLQLSTVPLCPNQKSAPPLRDAVLFVNVELDMVPFIAPLWNVTAPPLSPAKLSSNIPLLTVTLLQCASVPLSLPFRYIAPPEYAALLFVKFTVSILPSGPTQRTAPPSPPPFASVS